MLAPALIALFVFVAAPEVKVSPASPRLGDPVAVYLVDFEHGGESGSVEVFGYRFALMPIGPKTMRAVVALPSDVDPGPYTLAFAHPRGPTSWPAAVVEICGRTFEESHLTVAKKFTKKTRSAKLQARLKREQAEIQQVWSSTPTPALLLGQPVRPTRTKLTGFYGTARVFNKTRRSVHYGVDLNGRIGEPVYASAAGRVVMSSMRWGSGGTLVLDHGGGLYTTYFHLSKRRVALGDTVEQGQRIGDVGRSGRVTGPHLHFGVAIRAVYASGERAGRARSLYVDPEGFWALQLGREPQ